MGKIRGWNNSAELDALLKSSEVKQELARRAQRAAVVAGPGYTSELNQGRTRAMAMVYPATYGARRAERKYHRLMIAQDALRGGDS